MKTVSILSLFFFFSIGVFAQSPEESQQNAISKMDWIVGEWTGSAWTQMGPEKRDTVLMNEKISKDLNGTILRIQGVGYKLNSSGEKEIAHDAFAVVSFDPQTNKYRWHSWRVPGGYFTQHLPEVTKEGFSWAMETPQGKMKYNVSLNKKGQWHETGHFSADGENWFPFFEMLLDKN